MDRDHEWIVASVVRSGGEGFVTGDRELLGLGDDVEGVRCLSPRDLWEMLSTFAEAPHTVVEIPASRVIRIAKVDSLVNGALTGAAPPARPAGSRRVPRCGQCAPVLMLWCRCDTHRTRSGFRFARDKGRRIRVADRSENGARSVGATASTLSLAAPTQQGPARIVRAGPGVWCS
jgi:hypothetical protein